MRIGDTVWYDGKRAVVVALSPGEYGERVSFKSASGTIVTTTPGLDPRFSREKTCVKCSNYITTPLLGDQEERCVRCADYDPDDPDIGELDP